MMNKKKIIRISLLMAIVSIAIYLFTSIYHKIKLKKEIAVKTLYLPDFSFKSTAGITTTKNSLDKEKNTLIIYFNTQCEHCQYEAQEIRKKLQKFLQTQILFVSTEDKQKIIKFAEEYGLSKEKNIFFLVDRDHKFFNYFGSLITPSLFIYNKKNKLIKVFKGETKMEAILALI